MKVEFQPIFDFVTDKIGAIDFFEKNLYQNDKLQGELEMAKEALPFANGDTLLMFLLQGNPQNLEFLVDAKDALRSFLIAQGIEVSDHSIRRDLRLLNVIGSVQPKWLDIEASYFQPEIDFCGDDIALLKRSIKEKINGEFLYLKKPPSWLQSPKWPIRNGKPLVFVGELDMSDATHDTSRAFIFFEKLTNSFEVISQTA